MAEIRQVHCECDATGSVCLSGKYLHAIIVCNKLCLITCLLQSKLRQLDDKQQELIRDNLELKELCLYLDEERANALQMQNCTSCGAANGNNPVLRDDGDGSSSSTNADEPIPNNMHNYDQNVSVR